MIQQKRHPWDKESLGRGRRGKVLVKEAKKVAKVVGFRPRDLVAAARPKRKFAYPADGWLVQSFHEDPVRVGYLPYDPCMQYVPLEIKRYMMEKKMMQLRIPVDLHKWFKMYCQKNDTHMTTVIISYLERLRSRHRMNYEETQF